MAISTALKKCNGKSDCLEKIMFPPVRRIRVALGMIPIPMLIKVGIC